MNPEDFTVIATDVGIHAGREALAAIMRVLGSAPQGARTATLAVACAYVQHKLDGMQKIGTPEQRDAFLRAFEGTREILNRGSDETIAKINAGDFDRELVAVVKERYGL